MTVPSHSQNVPPTTPHGVLSHVGGDGSARMVDVGDKPITSRVAVAEGFVRISPILEERIRANSVAKGSVLEVARLAGIVAAKRTDELIPLCHAIALDSVEVEAQLESGRIRINATVRSQSRTGVEMEALTAIAIACLTIIDMGKAVDKEMVVEGIRVLKKQGGRSGTYEATPTEKAPGV